MPSTTRSALPAIAPATPSARSLRSWAIALALTVLTGAIGLFLFLISFGFTVEEYAGDPPQRLVALATLDAALGLLGTIAIGPLRFIRPGRLHTVLHLLIAASVGFSIWAMLPSAIALYRLGMQRRLRIDVCALALVATTSLTSLILDATARSAPVNIFLLATVGAMVLVSATPLLIGRVRATRHELLLILRERAAAADREREAADRERIAAEQARASAERARLAAEGERAAAEREASALLRQRDAEAGRVRAEERAALARDMHDSVSHHLALISMHAGAMEYREDLPPEAVRRAATTVREAAQRANRELRDVLTALRTGDTDEPLATAPTLTSIVERARRQGQDVQLSWHGLRPGELSEHSRGTVVALARILTEIVANAAKHSPGRPLAVTLARQGDRAVITARNPLPEGEDPSPVPSTGHGLIGVQERARLLGGDARRTTEDDVFEVEAWVPW